MKIKLLQWNIWYRENIENIASTIQGLDPDIVCLQELGFGNKHNPLHPDTVAYLKETLGLKSYIEEAQRWEHDDELNAIGNGIFSKFPIKRTSKTFVQEQTPAYTDYAHEGRIYIEAEVDIKGTRISVGTTHLSYTHRFIITDEKKREVDNLLAVLKEKKEKYIITGDLNSLPDSYTITELSKYMKNCGPSLAENSWTTKPSEHRGFVATELNWRLDYVFATKDITVESSKIVSTQFSDHLPILVTFEAP